MNKYECPKCKGDQYSSSKDKENEPCIYCGNPTTKLVSEGVKEDAKADWYLMKQKNYRREGMARITKDEYYLGIALAVSKRSTCLKRKYGCVIVKNDEIIATGYNGSPRGTENCCDNDSCHRMSIPHNSGDYSDCPSVHAEQNAMLSASRKDMMGSTLYIACEEYDADLFYGTGGKTCWKETLEECRPCPICRRMVKNAGIVRIVNRGGDVCM